MIVHILMAGRALCKPGTPDTWPDDERWIDKKDLSLVTCYQCRKIYEELVSGNVIS